MKFNIRFVITILLLFITLSSAAHLRSRTSAEANFSFTNLNLKVNGINNFKGHVGLDAEGKGIVISTTESDSNDKMLRLISEKLDSDAYLIDFRLFRSCDLQPKINKYGKNLSLTFSPKSLENRSKTEKYDVTVEIMDFRSFISEEKYSTEEQIKDYLYKRCATRKNAVETLKRLLSDSIRTFTDKTVELGLVNEKLSTQSAELESLRTAVADTQAQIKDINYLQNSYKMQLKSIDSLTNGANKLISKETENQKEIKEKENSFGKKLQKKLEAIKNKEAEIAKEKEIFRKLIDEAKEIENSMIKQQSNLAEEENNLSNINTNKMKLSYDLKNAKTTLKKIKEQVASLIGEIEKMKKTTGESDLKLKRIKAQKSELSEIENFQKKINELILKKSKKEEALKQKFDLLNSKEDEISKLKIEIDSNYSGIKSLEDKKENLKLKEEKTSLAEISNVEAQYIATRASAEKANANVEKVKTKLSEINSRRDAINKSSDENKSKISQKSQNLMKLQSDKNEIEKRINDSQLGRKDKEIKLKNLKAESFNYKNEIANIDKSLLSAQDNLETFNSILTDFNAKLSPVEEKFNGLVKEKQRTEADIKAFKGKIKSASVQMKKETPSATIMIDLAEDEALDNSSNGEESPLSGKANGKDTQAKWRQLIDNIIA
jgi:chromosome segregation ATPase